MKSFLTQAGSLFGTKSGDDEVTSGILKGGGIARKEATAESNVSQMTAWDGGVSLLVYMLHSCLAMDHGVHPNPQVLIEVTPKPQVFKYLNTWLC